MKRFASRSKAEEGFREAVAEWAQGPEIGDIFFLAAGEERDEIVVTMNPSIESFVSVDIALNIFAELPLSEENAPAFDTASAVERVRAGDEDAARKLFAHLHPQVVRIVRAHLPRRSSPEDLVQMVFIKVFTRLHQYSGKVPLEHWVSRIAVNTCINQLKFERARPEWRWADLTPEQTAALEAVEMAGDEPLPEHALAASELVGLLLDRLPPGDRMLVTLHYLEHKSVAEIGQLSGSSGVNIRIRLFRARRRMKKHLQSLPREETP
jgi:RNA polymerase sigma-70 factor (ECF subfamily)